MNSQSYPYNPQSPFHPLPNHNNLAAAAGGNPLVIISNPLFFHHHHHHLHHLHHLHFPVPVPQQGNLAQRPTSHGSPGSPAVAVGGTISLPPHQATLMATFQPPSAPFAFAPGLANGLSAAPHGHTPPFAFPTVLSLSPGLSLGPTLAPSVMGLGASNHHHQQQQQLQQTFVRGTVPTVAPGFGAPTAYGFGLSPQLPHGTGMPFFFDTGMTMTPHPFTAAQAGRAVLSPQPAAANHSRARNIHEPHLRGVPGCAFVDYCQKRVQQPEPQAQVQPPPPDLDNRISFQVRIIGVPRELHSPDVGTANEFGNTNFVRTLLSVLFGQPSSPGGGALPPLITITSITPLDDRGKMRSAIAVIMSIPLAAARDAGLLQDGRPPSPPSPLSPSALHLGQVPQILQCSTTTNSSLSFSPPAGGASASTLKSFHPSELAGTPPLTDPETTLSDALSARRRALAMAVVNAMKTLHIIADRSGVWVGKTPEAKTAMQQYSEQLSRMSAADRASQLSGMPYGRLTAAASKLDDREEAAAPVNTF